MSRLIDADALKDEYMHMGYDEHSEESYTEGWCKGYNAAVDHCIDHVIHAPTIDAVEVVHGEWIVKENHGTGWYRITCSECGEDVTSTAPCIGFMPIIKVLWNYCPECGAKMDGERKESE